MINAIKIREYFERTLDKNAYTNALPALLQAFFSDSDLSLRTIAQAIHRLGLVVASLRSNQESFVPMAVVLLIIRTIDSDIYCKFIRGEINDFEVVKTVFGRPEIKELRQRREGYLLEAVIILGAQEQAGKSSLHTIKSPLYEKYKNLVDSEQHDLENPDYRHAYGVLERIDTLSRSRSYGDTLGFKESVQRLELLTPSLIDERTEAASQDS